MYPSRATALFRPVPVAPPALVAAPPAPPFVAEPPLAAVRSPDPEELPQPATTAAAAIKAPVQILAFVLTIVLTIVGVLAVTVWTALFDPLCDAASPLRNALGIAAQAFGARSLAVDPIFGVSRALAHGKDKQRTIADRARAPRLVSALPRETSTSDRARRLPSAVRARQAERSAV